MEPNDELVDLSLFAVSPTNDSHFAVSDPPSLPHQTSRSAYTENTLRTYAENTLQNYDYYHPRSCTMKPLPPLPSRRLGGRRGPFPDTRDVQSCCILRRIRRPRPDEPLFDPHHSIPQRRNIPPPPQLTLSVPETSIQQRARSHTSPSPMVWLPDEQMWLTSDEALPGLDREAYQESPPAYTRRNYSRSESPPTRHFHYDLTPPLSPVQDQLRSLLEPREEDRLLSSSLSEREPIQEEMPRAPAMMDWSASYFPPSSSTPSLRVERDVPSRETSFRSAVSRFEEETPRETCSWEWVARRVVRPASTM